MLFIHLITVHMCHCRGALVFCDGPIFHLLAIVSDLPASGFYVVYFTFITGSISAQVMTELVHCALSHAIVPRSPDIRPICITLPVESAPFIPSTSFCSLSSWFTPFCAYHLITVTTFALAIYHSLVFHFRHKTHLFHKFFPP